MQSKNSTETSQIMVEASQQVSSILPTAFELDSPASSVEGPSMMGQDIRMGIDKTWSPRIFSNKAQKPDVTDTPQYSSQPDSALRVKQADLDKAVPSLVADMGTVTSSMGGKAVHGTSRTKLALTGLS